ncbi:MAG: divalent-cation tolerance protein CutA [Sphingomonas sp.]|nr:divalent-cation tolerance protein CutA [Sphingomonas sp.]
MSVVTVYALFASEDEARRIGTAMVEEGLAACVNILGPCHSVYRWKGKVESATEVPALFKTRLDRSDALIARVADLHSYEVPAIVVWPIERLSADYADWVEASVTLS